MASENPFRRRPPVPVDRDQLADAFRSYNCRHNTEKQTWDEIEEHRKEMWRERADWITGYIKETYGDS